MFFITGCAADNSFEKAPEAMEQRWTDRDRVDIRTGARDGVSDFSGKQVLLESFAVWCQLCIKQQQEIEKQHEERSDAVSGSLVTKTVESLTEIRG